MEINKNTKYILNSKHILNSDLRDIRVYIVREDEQGLRVRPCDAKLYKQYGVLNTFVSMEDLKEVK